MSIVREVWVGRELSIETRLSPDELERRIAAHVAPERWPVAGLLARSEHELVGEVSGGQIWIRCEWPMARSLRLVLRGRIEPVGQDSRLVGELDLERPVVVLLYVIRFVAALFGLAGVFAMFAGAPPAPSLALVGVGVAVFAITFPLRRYRSSRDERAIWEMLRSATGRTSHGCEASEGLRSDGERSVREARSGVGGE